MEGILPLVRDHLTSYSLDITVLIWFREYLRRHSEIDDLYRYNTLRRM